MLNLFRIGPILLALCAGPSIGQSDYPSKPIRIMVGANAGGGTDVIARMLGEKFAESLKQPLVIENRPGASNTIAADLTAKAPADGYTLLLATNTGQAIAPHLLKLAAKLLARPRNVDAAEVIVFADPATITAGERVANVKALLGPGSEGRATLHALDLGGEGAITPGVATRAGGRAALTALEGAARAARQGDVDGIVFAPMNKHALRLAGMTHEDELRLLQERFGVAGFVSEFNITGPLWTSRVTSHVPLRDVADAISVVGIVDAVKIVHRYLVASGRRSPRIAVTGLNPHAGDGGSIGREEIEVIAPAITRARELGIEAVGPMPSDTVFLAAKRGDYDAVVTMYHDQGQIAMKLMGFDTGVTLHGGLPVPVATCASGTAFDIVGRNVANVEGLQQAFDLAVAIASRTRSTVTRPPNTLAAARERDGGEGRSP